MSRPSATARHWLPFGLLAAVLVAAVARAEVTTATGVAEEFAASDSPFPEASALTTDAQREQLAALAWEAKAFAVRVSPLADSPGVRTVTFPSAKPGRSAFRDTVYVTWHPANPDADAPRALDTVATVKPAVVLVHSLHPQMLIARTFAPRLAQRGVHAFVVELPGFGRRRAPGDRWPAVEAVVHGRQGVADIRRACDAVAALPGVDPDRITLHGTSMGTFPAAVAAGTGARHGALVLFLGGADPAGVLEHGDADAERLRRVLDRHGIDAGDRAQHLAPLEPLHLAPRLKAEETWLLAAQQDQVIPIAHAEQLAAAIGLDDERLIRLNSDHYWVASALPHFADHLADVALGLDPLPPTAQRTADVDTEPAPPTLGVTP